MTKILKTKIRPGKLSQGEIKTKIESEMCPVHRERPVVTIVDENDINVYGCCAEFEEYCKKEIQRILVQQTANH